MFGVACRRRTHTHRETALPTTTRTYSLAEPTCVCSFFFLLSSERDFVFVFVFWFRAKEMRRILHSHPNGNEPTVRCLTIVLYADLLTTSVYNIHYTHITHTAHISLLRGMEQYGSHCIIHRICSKHERRRERESV